MTMPTFTAPPAAPARTDAPATFVTKANAFVAWFATNVSEMAAAVTWVAAQVAAVLAGAAAALVSQTDAAASAAAAVGATDSYATSASSLSLSAGTKTVVLGQAGKLFAAADEVVLIRRGDPTQRMYGVIAAWDGVNTMTVTVTSDGVIGSGGPFTDWGVILAIWATPGASAADIRTGASAFASITPAAEYAALAPVALVDAATVTPDFGAGIDFTWTIGGNRTLANPTNAKVGQRGTIEITQDATGSRVLAVGSAWKRMGGLGVLSTAPGAIDDLIYEVKAVSAGVATRIIYDLVKAPS